MAIYSWPVLPLSGHDLGRDMHLSEARHHGLNEFNVIVFLVVCFSGEARDLLIILVCGGNHSRNCGGNDESQYLVPFF